MTNNRSAPWARVVPVLVVEDVRAAVAWYEQVFGLVEHVRIGEGHRAQLGLPDERAELIVSEVRPDGRRLPQDGRSHQVMLRVADVDGVLAAARERVPTPTTARRTGSTASARPGWWTRSAMAGCSRRRCATSIRPSGAGQTVVPRA